MAYIGRDIQYGTLDKQSFTANSSATVFTLNTTVKDAKSLLVSVGGVIQEPDVAYTASGTTLTFSEAPVTGNIVYVIYLGKELIAGATRESITYQSGTGNGSTTPVTLSAAANNAQSIMVMLNGVTQTPETDYTVNGTTLTFNEAVPNGVAILVYHLANQAQAFAVNDASVTNAHIVSLDASKLTGNLPSGMGTNTTTLDQSIASLALHVGVSENKIAYNLPESYIDVFQDDSGILTETTVDRDAAGEYVGTLTSSTTYGDTVTLYEIAGAGAAVGSGWNNYRTRTRLPMSASAGRVRFTVNTTGAGDLIQAGFGQAVPASTPGTNNWDTVDTPQEILWGGSSGASGTNQVSDWLNFSVSDSNYYIFTATNGDHNLILWWNSGLPANTHSSTSADGTAGFGTLVADVPDDGGYAYTYFLKKVEGQPLVSSTTASATGTLISKASTAAATVSTVSGVMLYEDAEGTGTLGTDLKIYFSSDDGANWTEASSYGNSMTFSGDVKMVPLGATTLTGGTGTAVKMKAEWANQAEGTPETPAGPTDYTTAGVGTGDRKSSITVSSSLPAQSGSNWQNMVDGDIGPGSASNSAWWANSQNSAGQWLKFDFGSAKTIVEAKYHQDEGNTTAHQGQWKWQGSNDDSTWTDIGSQFQFGGELLQTQTELNGNTTAYRYYRLLGISGTTVYNYQMEMEFGTAGTAGSPAVDGKVQRLHGWAVNY